MFFPYWADTGHMEEVPVASSLIPEQRGLLWPQAFGHIFVYLLSLVLLCEAAGVQPRETQYLHGINKPCSQAQH